MVKKSAQRQKARYAKSPARPVVAKPYTTLPKMTFKDHLWVIRRIYGLMFRAHKLYATLYFLFIVLDSIAPAVNMYIWARVIDAVVLVATGAAAVQTLWMWFGIYFIWRFFTPSGNSHLPLGYLRNVFMKDYRYRLSLLYDVVTFRALEKLPVSALERHDMAEIYRKIKERASYQEFWSQVNTLENIALNLLRWFWAVLLLSLKLPEIMILAVFGAGIYFWIDSINLSELYMRYENTFNLTRRAVAAWKSALSYVDVLRYKILGIFKYIVRRWTPLTYVEWFFNNKAYQYRSGIRRLATSTALFFLDVYVYFRIIALIAIQKVLSIGDLTFYVGLYGDIWRLRSIGSDVQVLAREMPYFKLFFNLVDLKYTGTPREKKILQKQRPLPVDYTVSDIYVKDVWFNYPFNPHWTLRGINMTIPKGANIAIVGPNGAGKTTLIKILLGVYINYYGKVLVDKNTDLKYITFHSWQKNISYLPQDFPKLGFLTPAQVITLDKTKLKYDKPLAIKDIDVENLYFKDRRQLLEVLKKLSTVPGFDISKYVFKSRDTKVSKQVIKAAKLAQAHDFILRLRKKYNTLLSPLFEDGSELSFGQWQRLHIARVIYAQAPIGILDEPTSAIDPGAAFKVVDNVFKAYEKSTVIVVSHRYANISNADIIYVVDGGQIVESGTHKQLIKQKGLYAKAYHEELSRL